MTMIINNTKCIRCGKCAKVCSLGVIQFKDNSPLIADFEKCIHCHHCYSVCPVGALSIDSLDVEKKMPVSIALPDDVLSLLEHRYSCREYKQESVSEDVMLKLRRALISAPTGCNAKLTQYLIFDKKEKTDLFRETIRKQLEKADPEVIKSMPFLRAFAVMIKRGLDPVLRGAPHLIIAAYEENAPTGETDSVIGLSHFEFVAQAMGLGTCWCGFIELAITKIWESMAEDIGFPKGYKIGYAMLFGEKAFDYARPTASEQAEIKESEFGTIIFPSKF